jgi:hypothetical protein
MPVYLFHIRNSEHTDDEEGTDLPDLAAARDHALEGARDLVCADIKKGWLNLDHYIEVADQSGTLLFRLTFREAFQIEGRQGKAGSSE